MNKFLVIVIMSFCHLLASAQEQTDSLFVNTKSENKETTFKVSHLILPTCLITAGVAGNYIPGMKDFHLFKRQTDVKQIRIDDYFEWGMLGWVFFYDLMGKEKHNWKDQLGITLIAEGINGCCTHSIKKIANEIRPDGKPYSFPSGHTANAFLGAHIAYKEFKESNTFLAYSGYFVATAVGCSRLRNNRHWVCDVLTGAGIGILSVELSYLIYFPLRNLVSKYTSPKLGNQLSLAPSINPSGAGFYLNYHF